MNFLPVPLLKTYFEHLARGESVEGTKKEWEQNVLQPGARELPKFDLSLSPVTLGRTSLEKQVSEYKRYHSHLKAIICKGKMTARCRCFIAVLLVIAKRMKVT